MEKSRDRAVQFEKELKALLKKWNAEIELEDDSSYTYAISNIIKVYIPAIWNKDGECIAENTEIDLGDFYDAN